MRHEVEMPDFPAGMLAISKEWEMRTGGSWVRTYDGKWVIAPLIATPKIVIPPCGFPHENKIDYAGFACKTTDGLWYVMCTHNDCSAHGPIRSTKEAAIAAWKDMQDGLAAIRRSGGDDSGEKSGQNCRISA